MLLVDELTPPPALLEMLVGWITEDPRLLLLTFINTPLNSSLPLGCLEITPLLGLLRWCVKAPLVYQRGRKSALTNGHGENEKGTAYEELYSKLHLSVLQVFLMLQVLYFFKIQKTLLIPEGNCLPYYNCSQEKERMNK